jgi:UDP-4-amino-4,6-dideoxy-N-acetyl-beta-L-altrosamine N-acetyltransferase
MRVDKCLMTSITDLSNNDKEMILKWRNHDSIRVWMHNPKIIEKIAHFEFIEKLKFDKENSFFIVKKDSTNIGVIYFNNIDFKKKSANFGLYGKPNSKGLGKTLMNTLVNYAFNDLNIDRLIAEVFANNTKAISLYKKFNFLQKEIKTINQKNILILELKNEKLKNEDR